MGTVTWTYTSSTSNTKDQGNSWNTFPLTSSSTLPSGVTITNVEYTAQVYIGSYGSSLTTSFQLYAIAVEGGPYTGAKYSTTSSPSTKITTFSAKTSSSNKSEDTAASGSTLNGTYKVWRNGTSGTYGQLTDCDFASNINTPSAFDSTTLNVKLRMNYSGSGTAYVRKIVVKVTYEEPEWKGPPSITSITNNNNGEFTINWTAADWSGNKDLVCYEVVTYQNGEQTFISDFYYDLTGTFGIDKYDTPLTFIIRASEYAWSDNQIDSASYEFTFHSPTLSAPTISISPIQGQSTTVTCGKVSELKYGNSNSQITYTLYRGSSESKDKVYEFPATETTYTIPEGDLDDWGLTEVPLFIEASILNVNPVVGGRSSLSKQSDIVYFAYEPYKTICYYNGSKYEECIVYYFTGDTSQGIDGWVECEPYYYTGNTSTGNNGWQICSYT